MSERDRCVRAGMLMEQWAKLIGSRAYEATSMFPATFRGSVPDAEFVVPHSELAMRTHGAG